MQCKVCISESDNKNPATLFYDCSHFFLESWQCCLFCCQVLIIANKGQEITYFLYIFRYMIQYVRTQSTNTYYSHGHENLYGVSENMHIYHMMKEQKCPSVMKKGRCLFLYPFMK